MEEMSADVATPFPLLALGASTTHFAHGTPVADPRLLLQVGTWKIFLLQAERVVRFTAGDAVEHLAASRCAADETEILFRSLLTADNTNAVHGDLLLVERLKEINGNIAFAWRKFFNVDREGFQGFLWRATSSSPILAKFLHLNARKVLRCYSSRLKTHRDEALKAELEILRNWSLILFLTLFLFFILFIIAGVCVLGVTRSSGSFAVIEELT